MRATGPGCVTVVIVQHTNSTPALAEAAVRAAATAAAAAASSVCVCLRTRARQESDSRPLTCARTSCSSTWLSCLCVCVFSWSAGVFFVGAATRRRVCNPKEKCAGARKQNTCRRRRRRCRAPPSRVFKPMTTHHTSNISAAPHTTHTHTQQLVATCPSSPARAHTPDVIIDRRRCPARALTHSSPRFACQPKTPAAPPPFIMESAAAAAADGEQGPAAARAAAPAAAAAVVFDSLDAAAAAQQGERLLALYDFKLRGAGLSAPANAVPLPTRDVLLAAPPAAAAAAEPEAPPQPPPLRQQAAAAAAVGDNKSSVVTQPPPPLLSSPAASLLGGSSSASATTPPPPTTTTTAWLRRAGLALLALLLAALRWLARAVLLAPAAALLGPIYRANVARKAATRRMLAEPPDLAALAAALGALPSWLAGVGVGATERLGWLNELLAQAWPVVDPVACALVRATIEPLLHDLKPPFLAAVGFQSLALGELPVELEGMRVVGGGAQGVTGAEGAPHAPGAAARLEAADAARGDRLELEVDFAWRGEPNVSFYAELAGMGPSTRLVAKVSRLSARGTLRVGLARLVPKLPGFGAALVSFARAPQIQFTLDFGPALGGSAVAKPVAAFLDPFLRDTLASLMVWPNRFVLPLLPRADTGSLDDLALHSLGVLEVEVLGAERVPKRGGRLSTVDPQVELWTQPQHRAVTTTKRMTRAPDWRGERLELLVQEPDSQLLRAVLRDVDALNVKELLQANLLRGAASLLRVARPVGRAALPLRDVCARPGERQAVTLRLSGSEAGFELGLLEDEDVSTLRLALTYKPFTDETTAGGRSNAGAGVGAGVGADVPPPPPPPPMLLRGVLFVDVRRCAALPTGDWDSGSSDSYVVLRAAAQRGQTAIVPNSLSPVFNSHHEFFGVTAADELVVQVYDRDYLKPDDLLGALKLPLAAVIAWRDNPARCCRDGWWRLRGGAAGAAAKNKGGGKGKGAGKGAGRAPRIELKVWFRAY